jgi:hypothetical protein
MSGQARRERFFSYIQQPVPTLAELQVGQQAFGAEEIQGFLPTIQDLDQTLRELAPLLTEVDGFRASILALLCGAFVERGGDPTIPIHATLELVRRQLVQLKTYLAQQEELTPEQLFTQFPAEIRAHYGIQFSYKAAMTMLSRDVHTRKTWPRHDTLALIEELEDDYEQLYYLREALTLLDERDLLVLDPQHKRGFHVRLVGVRDRMYHCFALLQHTILERTGPGYLNAEPTDPAAVSYARNHGMTPELYARAGDLGDEQRFRFQFYSALQPDYTVDAGNILSYCYGSGQFEEIPLVDGMPVLLIAEKTMSFQWSPANMYSILHEALTSSVDLVRELERGEVEGWLEKIVQM